MPIKPPTELAVLNEPVPSGTAIWRYFKFEQYYGSLVSETEALRASVVLAAWAKRSLERCLPEGTSSSPRRGILRAASIW